MDEVQFEIRKNGSNYTYYYSGSSLYTVPMIIAGLGLAIMPDFVCPPSGEVTLRSFEPPCHLEYGIIYRNNDRSDRVRSFVEIRKANTSRIRKAERP